MEAIFYALILPELGIPRLPLSWGAVGVTFNGYRLIQSRRAPVFDSGFHLSTNRKIDARLVGGAALFGIGWGIAGFCSGGALPALSAASAAAKS